jgi:hypothetical protein
MTSFSKSSLKDKEVYNLKKILLEYKKSKNSTLKLVVLENGTKIIEDNRVIDIDLKVDKDIEFFAYDIEGEEVKKSSYSAYELRFNNFVNFVYTIYPNGSSTPMVMRIKDNFYVYKNYFEGEVKRFDDKYEAKDYLLNSEIKSNLVVINE